ncbi:TRAM domain-containing protein, partial [Arthrobacter ramosus]
MTHPSNTESSSPTAQDGAATELVVDVGPIAHGGHFVARHEGRVIFVRHGIPGEKVRVRLTDAGESSRFWRADVVDVLEASEDRTRHFWPLADSLAAWRKGGPPVGGAELGHVTL